MYDGSHLNRIHFFKFKNILLQIKIIGKTNEDDLELLCLDGSRRPISEFHNCNWGPVPTDAIMTTSAKSSSVRSSYQRWIQVLYSINNLYGSKFKPLK